MLAACAAAGNRAARNRRGFSIGVSWTAVGWILTVRQRRRREIRCGS
jgi:hypothetical protein